MLLLPPQAMLPVSRFMSLQATPQHPSPRVFPLPRNLSSDTRHPSLDPWILMACALWLCSPLFTSQPRKASIPLLPFPSPRSDVISHVADLTTSKEHCQPSGNFVASRDSRICMNRDCNVNVCRRGTSLFHTFCHWRLLTCLPHHVHSPRKMAALNCCCIGCPSPPMNAISSVLHCAASICFIPLALKKLSIETLSVLSTQQQMPPCNLGITWE